MKITSFQLILAFGLVASTNSSLTAQPADRPGRGERPDREAQRKQILERFDKNKDGQLDEEEREAARESFRSGGGPNAFSNERGRPGGPPDASGRAAGPPPDRGGRARGGLSLIHI